MPPVARSNAALARIATIGGPATTIARCRRDPESAARAPISGTLFKVTEIRTRAGAQVDEAVEKLVAT